MILIEYSRRDHIVHESELDRGCYVANIKMASVLVHIRFPQIILPNLDHKHIDLSNDADLHNSLINVANSSHSNLRIFSSSQFASLINDAMPVQ